VTSFVVYICIFFVLSGYFAQLLRYTAPADARSTIVRLRSAGTASLAFEQNSTLKMSEVRMLKWVGKKGEILERIYWIEKVVAVWRSKDFLVGVYEKIWLWWLVDAGVWCATSGG
jgi:hypothetical protein